MTALVIHSTDLVAQLVTHQLLHHDPWINTWYAQYFFSCLWLLLSLSLTNIRQQRHSSLLQRTVFRTKLRELG